MQAVAKGGYGSTKVLLLCGILTGPLFLVVAIIQAITRSGYNVRLNAVSQLSLGDRGWIQITSFLLAGLLGVRCATGVRRLLKGQKGEGWAALLDGTFGLGLIVGAVFSPERPHATEHAAGFFLSMFPSSLTASFFCAVSTRLEKGWAVSP